MPNPTKALWTTTARLQRRLALNHSEGQGQLRRDGAHIEFRDDHGEHQVTGTVTGAAVVRPWLPWVTMLLWLVGMVALGIGLNMAIDPTDALTDGALNGAMVWSALAFQWSRTPFVRIDGIDDDGEPLVLHLHLKPGNPYRPAREAEALATTLRAASRAALTPRLVRRPSRRRGR